MKKKAYNISRIYRLLEPGPVVMVTTALRGKMNVMTMSWHTMMEFSPPLIGCIISNRNHTFDMLKATKECVIAIPPAGLVKKVVRVGSVSGRDTDKFAEIGLTPEAAARVKAPLVAECFANIECKVVDTAMMDKYNFFVLKAVRAWVDTAQKRPKALHHSGKGIFASDGRKIKCPFRSSEP
ncbi:MAG: flavin reductase family protein [Candidatus Omnitrophica bacterium]|nr:flavin reductase family protein [Candidatus Omnitrophota bacterium]MDD5488866.1 flavin reductase family protein [Candidatus Omnitrophota bacterium]